MRTQRDEIREMISFTPVFKFSEWLYMMHFKLFLMFILCHSAYLASIAISLARLFSLTLPVRTVVGFISAFPGWIILSDSMNTDPLGATLVGTEMMFISIKPMRLSYDFFAAYLAGDAHRAPLATAFLFEMDSLPPRKTLAIAKKMLFVSKVAIFPEQYGAAKRAFNLDFSPVPSMGLFWIFFAPLIIALLGAKTALGWTRVLSLKHFPAMRAGLNFHLCTSNKLAALEAVLLSRQHAKAASRSREYDSCSCCLDKFSIARLRGVVNGI